MYAFSNAVNSMHSEDIKLLMKQASGKSMISFAGGMPNNDLFPVKQIDDIYNSLPEDIKKLCFQYGPTSGYPPLIKSLQSSRFNFASSKFLFPYKIPEFVFIKLVKKETQ